MNTAPIFKFNHAKFLYYSSSNFIQFHELYQMDETIFTLLNWGQAEWPEHSKSVINAATYLFKILNILVSNIMVCLGSLHVHAQPFHKYVCYICIISLEDMNY